jgi:prepilin-type N-terminal cleavage/methylation domain-containing protein
MTSIARKRTRGLRDSAAFTLVEILVAITILAIITVAMATIFAGTQTLVTQSNSSMGSLDAGEAVLSQIGLDISRMVLRDDVDYGFIKNGTDGSTGVDDGLSFYARTTGFDKSGNPVSSPRPLSVVSYQMGTDPVNASSTALQLNYGALQVDWAAGGSSPFTLSKLASGTQTQYLNASLGGDLPVPGFSTTLAREVIRFEYCFILKTDPGNNVPPRLLTPDVPATGSGVTAPIENVAGIVVGIVVVDPGSRIHFPAGADANLGKLFTNPPAPSPTTPTSDFLTLWSPVLTPANLKLKDIPATAISGIHIYQRYYPLPW